MIVFDLFQSGPDLEGSRFLGFAVSKEAKKEDRNPPIRKTKCFFHPQNPHHLNLGSSGGHSIPRDPHTFSEVVWTL